LRAGFDKRFQRQVDHADPGHELSEAARAKLLQSAKSAYFSRLALKRLKVAKKRD
jgi:hypothetical protein